MHTKIYWIENFQNGAAIGIMPRPRGNEWLEEEIKRWKEIGVRIVVSLLEKQEMEELGLRAEVYLCRQYQLTFFHHPIRDRDIPNDNLAISRLVKELKIKIDSGEKVVIHCWMGIGRAAIIAAAVLVQYGYTPSQLISKISQACGLKVPDTEQQINWLTTISLIR